MKAKMKLHKLLSMLLALVMVLALMPQMVFAEGNTSTAPRVSAYAAKTQLMDGTFAPKADGTAVNYGKIVFGKNSDGAPQEWYILGKDTGVSGDNTIIFAASHIAGGKIFNDSVYITTYNYDYEAGTGYGDSAGSIEVYPNHYGASNPRAVLKSMVDASNTSYFTTAEQGLMNATTVKTKDTKNDVTYTTTDKLYALQGDINNNQYLWAGTSDSTVLAINSYWSSGYNFWLRSPYTDYDSHALLAWPGSYVDNEKVDLKQAVQPASNLNLTSVLFASAATAASSDTAESRTIANGTAMTLRLDGTGKNIGTVTYNNTTGDIKATKGSTEGDVALVVQGNDGTSDWYYSKKIDTSETVNASAIKSALGLSSDIDLSDCKIWLEITDTDGLNYAAGADKEQVAPTTYTVSFAANGGTGTMADETGISGEYTLPKNGFTAPDGKQFKGWATSATDSVITDNSITVTADITLYAIWEDIPATTYTVTVNDSYAFTTGAGEYAVGETVNISAGSRSGYTFDGWTSSNVTITNADSRNASFVMPDNDVTVTARWTRNAVPITPTEPFTYTIKVEKMDNGDVIVSHKSAAKGTTVTITVEPDEGYTLETLTVTDKNGDEIELTNKGDGKYTFKMPASKVYVEATFMEDNSMLNFFVDVPADVYYYDAVLWAGTNSITDGTDDTHFSPNATCTRAQAVTFLWRAAGCPAPKSSEMPFEDVAAGSYYYDAVLWAVENGITDGTGATTFSPDAVCSRGQIVTFLWRSQKSPASDSVNPFTDVAADAYYNSAVLWAVTNGITDGTGDGSTFSPAANCTRAQIVTFIWRALAE